MPDRFTVYDVFAVLIPGILIGSLLGLTVHIVAGWSPPTWITGLGDASKVLAILVAGYAFGEMLQALGKAFTTWLNQIIHTGPHASTNSLLIGSGLWSDEFRVEVLSALQDRYGALPSSDTPTYRARLHEMTDRAFKLVETKDPTLYRQLAEQHQMRAHFVGFLSLAIFSILSIFFVGHQLTLILLGGVYGVLAGLALWRMAEKDRTVAHDVWIQFMEVLHNEKLPNPPAKGEESHTSEALRQYWENTTAVVLDHAEMRVSVQAEDVTRGKGHTH